MSSKVHNYYEHLVFDALERRLKEKALSVSEVEFEDISCIALNRLPARYVRYAIDTTFYATPDDLHQMETMVDNAIEYAISFVMK